MKLVGNSRLLIRCTAHARRDPVVLSKVHLYDAHAAKTYIYECTQRVASGWIRVLVIT